LQCAITHEGVGFAEVHGSDVPAEHALRGFAGVSLLLRSASKTIDLLTRTLGYAEVGKSDGMTRLMAQGADTAHGAVMGRIIDVHEDQGAQRGRTGSGTVHHIAFRTKDDAEQRAWQDALAQRGLHATEILDRQYFHSIYVREPGGVLLEFATDAPGFAVDEPLATLGQELKLPAQYEGMRDALRARLPALVE
jgi:glyoxalase family protein